MNQATKEEDILNDNVIDFSTEKVKRKGLITGGPTAPENWLKDLVPGTIFLARPIGDTQPMLHKYFIDTHLTQSTHMVWGMPDNKQIDIWVPTLEFSRKFKLHEVIGVIALDEPEEQQQVSDGLASQEESVGPSGRLASPEGTEGEGVQG